MNNKISSRVRNLFWRDIDPFGGFPYKNYRPDFQGWNSSHPFLSEAASLPDTDIALEVGVWKGGSTLTMAECFRNKGRGVVIAIDTFLGSWEHWNQPEYFEDLRVTHGYPQLFYTFITNVCELQLQEFIIPLPLDSGNASQLVSRKGLTLDLIHIDGGHDEDAVTGDLKRWWSRLKPGGVMIVDDYDPEGKVWPSVRDAVDHFRASEDVSLFKASPYKCWMTKSS